MLHQRKEGVEVEVDGDMCRRGALGLAAKGVVSVGGDGAEPVGCGWSEVEDWRAEVQGARGDEREGEVVAVSVCGGAE